MSVGNGGSIISRKHEKDMHFCMALKDKWLNILGLCNNKIEVCSPR